jgi:type VI secretion system Hcp family effector
MAFAAYLTVKNQGNNITAGASGPNSIGQAAPTVSPMPKTQGGVELTDTATVLKFLSDLQIPTLAGAGVISSGRIYQPVVITKHIDSMSPQFWQALAVNTVFDSFTLDIFRDSPTSANAKSFYTIEWDTVTIVEAKQYSPLVLDPSLIWMPYLEDISFTFKKVTWNQIPASTSGGDTYSN